MFERFTGQARTVVIQAQDHARRLGHNYIGCEHLLLAAASTAEPASAVLREHGVTPQAVETQIVRLIGLGQAARRLGSLDRSPLAPKRAWSTPSARPRCGMTTTSASSTSRLP